MMESLDPEKLKVLFVCSQNRLRSPTAEKVFSGHAGLTVKSAGIERDATVPLTADLLEWADLVFVMEKRQQNRIRTWFNELYKRKRIICLHIPDEYEYMDPALVSLLQQKLKTYFPPEPLS